MMITFIIILLVASVFASTAAALAACILSSRQTADASATHRIVYSPSPRTSTIRSATTRLSEATQSI